MTRLPVVTLNARDRGFGGLRSGNVAFPATSSVGLRPATFSFATSSAGLAACLVPQYTFVKSCKNVFCTDYTFVKSRKNVPCTQLHIREVMQKRLLFPLHGFVQGVGPFVFGLRVFLPLAGDFLLAV